MLKSTHPTGESRAVVMENHLKNKTLFSRLKKFGEMNRLDKKVRHWNFDKRTNSVVISNIKTTANKVGRPKKDKDKLNKRCQTKKRVLQTSACEGRTGGVSNKRRETPADIRAEKQTVLDAMLGTDSPDEYVPCRSGQGKHIKG